MRRIRIHGTTAGFIAAALILIVIGGLVVISANRYTADNEWVTHTYAVITQLENIRANQRDAIIAQRSYVLTNDRRDRSRFFEDSATLPLQIRLLATMVRDNPTQLRLTAQLQSMLAERTAIATRTLDVYDGQGLASTQNFMQSNGGRTLDARIGQLVATMRNNEERLLAIRRRTTDFSASLLLVSASLGIPLSLIILGVIYRLLAEENSQRRKAEIIASASNAELQGSLTQFRKLSSDMEGLSKYAGMLQSCTDVPELLDITRQAMLGLTPDIAGTLYLIRSSRDRAEAATSWGEHLAQSNALPLPSECWAIRRNQPYLCDNLHSDVKCAHVELPPPSKRTATACMPLSAHGEIMGWLYISGPGPGPLPSMELAFQAAEQFSLALANIRLRETLQHQSIRDPLTGLFNRRYLEESLAREISRCQRRQLPLAVLMFDIDHFKAFNDRHGHPGGDALLSAFGQLLQSKCRPEDIACRYGGEEFTLILPEAGAILAAERAKEILAAAAALVVNHQGNPLSRITTSIGIAVSPEDGISNSALIAAADKALYQAKTQGRNRAVTAMANH